MTDIIKKLKLKKIGGVRVVSTALKIIWVFTIFLLVSNFSSNYINLTMNQSEQIKLINQLLVRDLKELHIFATNQYEIFQYSGNEKDAVNNIVESGKKNFKRPGAIAFGIRNDGTVIFFAMEKDLDDVSFTDRGAMEQMNENYEAEKYEDTLNFRFNGKDYFGVYKYNEKWDMFIVRAEQYKELYRESTRIFIIISIIIVIITATCVVAGIIILQHILRFITVMTDQIMAMTNNQQLGLLDMKGAVNDEVTYLGLAFNNLSNTIDNLVTIFRKFVARDVAARAYKEKDIRLEGVKKELTILFTDIKGFTYMTETLGTDIIKLLNIHYDKAIKDIMDLNGDIGSIIGDALLAIFGVTVDEGENKSYSAIQAGYRVLHIAADLRQEMYKYESEIVRTRGYLSDLEKKILKAVLIEVGVGIDGGEVFYGNIGSTDRMVNTVIGDNVNSSSRLEGLTRIYKVPIICSEYVKNEVEKDIDRYQFLEIDTVQVKGKTIGKKVFWPLDKDIIDSDFKDQITIFSEGLKDYYSGNWTKAQENFGKCVLPIKEVFLKRITGAKTPENWNGIWTMKEK
jgi:class 3 adenylate cyclase